MGTVGLLLALAAVAAIARCGGADEPEQPAVAPPASEAEPPQPEGDAGDFDPEGEREARPEGPAEAERGPEQAAARAAARAYRSYVAAINDRDGERVCRLLAPGSEAELDLPVARGGCAGRITASIGYEDPRGFPVWERTVLSGIENTRIEERVVQVNAAVLTRFADREQPSVESDIAYLGQHGGRWRLVKPSGVLYRAVGKPEVPPRAITPP